LARAAERPGIRGAISDRWAAAGARIERAGDAGSVWLLDGGGTGGLREVSQFGCRRGAWRGWVVHRERMGCQPGGKGRGVAILLSSRGVRRVKGGGRGGEFWAGDV